MKNEDGITAIETAIPIAKTAKSSSYWRFASYMNALLSFYNFSTAKDRFNLYQGRQRAPEMTVNRLLDGGKKYNRQKRFKHERSKKSKKGKRKKKKKRSFAERKRRVVDNSSSEGRSKDT